MIAITLSSPDWGWQTAPLSLVDNRDTALWLVEPHSASKASAPSPQQESEGKQIKRHKMCSWSWVFHHLRVDQSGFLVLFDICEEVVRLLRIFHLTILKRPLLSSRLLRQFSQDITSLFTINQHFYVASQLSVVWAGSRGGTTVNKYT